MTTVQIVSIGFLLVMVVLILRGVRGHPRRRSEGVTLDATGNAVGRGAERMSHHLDTVGLGGSESGGGD